MNFQRHVARATVVVAFLSALPVIAQAGDAKSSEAATVEKLDAVTPHLRLEVHLRRGGVVHGVAIDGRMIERRERGGEYVALDESDKSLVDAGLRLWYYDDLPGFLFVPWRDVEKTRVVRRLLESEMKTYDERARAATPARAAAAKSSSVSPDTLSRQVLEPVGFSALDPAQRDLITAYPPADGYSPERYEAIQKALVLDGKQPSAVEADWMRRYPEWLAAWRAYHDIPAAAKVTPKSAPKAATSKSAATPKAAARPTTTTESAPRRRAVESRQQSSSSKPAAGGT